MAPFDRLHTSSCPSSSVTMPVSYTVFGIKPYWSKNAIFHITLYFICTIPSNPFEFLPKLLTQTVRVIELLGGAKYFWKVKALSRVQQRYRRQTDRETTDGRLTP